MPLYLRNRKKKKKGMEKKYPRGRKACVGLKWTQKIEACTDLLAINLCPQREEHTNQQP